MPTDATDAVYTNTCLLVPAPLGLGEVGKRSLHTPSAPSAVSPANCVALNPQVPQFPAKAFARNDPKHADPAPGQRYGHSTEQRLSVWSVRIGQSAQIGKHAKSSEHYVKSQTTFFGCSDLWPALATRPFHG